MLSQLVIVVFCIHVFFFNLIFCSISFNRDYRIPVDTCFNMSDYASSGKEYSFIYRCSDDSVWQFTYTDCMDCNCTYESYTLMGGCTSGSNMYRVFNCSDAQTSVSTDNCSYVATGSTYSSASAVSVGACVNYKVGSYYSSEYQCINGSLYYLQFSDYDCKGTNVSVARNSYHYKCGNDCSAHVMEYDNDETCNYADSNYRSANPSNKCNYLILGDGTAPIAIGVCTSFRQAYYEYSRKYVCSQDKSKVYLKQWMQSSDCDDSDSESYIIGEYSSDDYNTINCDSSTCNGKYRTYSSCSYQYQFTETPIVWNYCQKTYLNESKSTFNYSFNDYLYQMTTCVDGVMADFYFTDSSCKYFDTFVLKNTSSAGCQYELTGCENSNDVLAGSSSIRFSVLSYVTLFITMWLYISF